MSNGTNCNLDPAVFNPLPRKNQKKRPLLNFAVHAKLDLRPKIILSFLVIIALEVTKVVGFGSNIPCAAKFNGRLLFWKIFRGNRSKMAGCKLQLVLFYSFLYNKLIPESTFFILPQDCPKRHLPTWNTWKALSALMFNVKNPNRLYLANVCNEIKWFIKFKILFFRMISSWNWHHKRMNISENLM